MQAVAILLALSASANILAKASAGDCTGLYLPLATCSRRAVKGQERFNESHLLKATKQPVELSRAGLQEETSRGQCPTVPLALNQYKRTEKVLQAPSALVLFSPKTRMAGGLAHMTFARSNSHLSVVA